MSPPIAAVKPAALEAAIRGALVSLWHDTGRKATLARGRAKTLARIAVHESQFEAWWKFELAAALWDVKLPKDACVFVEQFDRSDIAIGMMKNGRFDSGPTNLRVPIELKTAGTFWKHGPGKALNEPGKKRLGHDMAAMAKRDVAPFGVVALLVTHSHACQLKWSLDTYVELAREIGQNPKHRLRLFVDEPIRLPDAEPGAASAHQLAWICPAK